MEEFLNTLLKTTLSEYGVLVAFLFVCIGVLIAFVRLLWLRNEFLGNKFLEIIPENTKVITQLVERIEHLDEN